MRQKLPVDRFARALRARRTRGERDARERNHARPALAHLKPASVIEHTRRQLLRHAPPHGRNDGNRQQSLPRLTPFAAQSCIPKRLGAREAARIAFARSRQVGGSHEFPLEDRSRGGGIGRIGRRRQRPGTLKAVMHSDVKIVDPIWTTAYITRNHGYMIYDTLFAMDEKGEIKPQMVDKYDESADKLTYTFTLRDGLGLARRPAGDGRGLHRLDQALVARDALGQKLMSFVDSMTANDAKTFTVKLKSPTGLLIFGLGKPSSNVPFMMPKRVGRHRPNTQISEFIGSGPFVFKSDEWKPGDKAVYVKFDKYKPRSEPASGMSGGKVVKLDRVEWLAIADQQQALNALLAGEIDYYEQPPIDLLPLLKGDSNVKLVNYNPLGLQYTFRPNHLQKPFDNPKVRQALFYAFNQKDFLDATIGNPEYYKVCKAMFVCGNPLASEKGMEGPARIELRQVARTAEGSQLRRHADRAACTRPTSPR
jgi:hypothetical protein